jgi:hypothetical protein
MLHWPPPLPSLPLPHHTGGVPCPHRPEPTDRRYPPDADRPFVGGEERLLSHRAIRWRRPGVLQMNSIFLMLRHLTQLKFFWKGKLNRL